MTKESIKNKIKKLLALAGNNPSDEESFSALQKAQQLMAEYKISGGEIVDKEEQKCVQVKTNFSYGTRSSDHYLSELANIIADNFCCITYISRVRGTRTNYICFMGLEEDVNVAITVMTSANMQIIRGYNRVYRDICKLNEIDYLPAKYFNPAKEGYIEGYLEGLKSALESQKEQQEWGLVLVAPEEAKNFLDSLDTTSGRTRQVNRSYYDEGYKDGSSFNMNKQIDEKKRLEENA